MTATEHPELRRNRRIREYWQLISQTAEYRFRICWQGARQVMTANGHDPSLTIQTRCDQGNDVNAFFVLPDGAVAACDFREDPVSGQAIGITSRLVQERTPGEPENEHTLAGEILRDPELKAAFDQAVRAYFDFHWRRDDAPFTPRKPQRANLRAISRHR